MASVYKAHDLAEFVSWLLADTHLENRTVVIANPSLTMMELARFFREDYIVVSPILRSVKDDTPWELVLRRKLENQGHCTCSTPFCCIQKGDLHVPIHGTMYGMK